MLKNVVQKGLRNQDLAVTAEGSCSHQLYVKDYGAFAASIW